MIPSRLLRTTYPCCGGPTRIKALAPVPRETYVRRCARCGAVWRVTRTPLPEQPGMAVDQLDWERVEEGRR